MKSLVSSAVAIALLVGSSTSAAALPAPASAERSGASIGDAEGVIAMPLLLALVFVFSIGLVAAVESSEDDGAPVSP